MDDDLKELEAELERLVPAALPPGLERRIAAELRQRPTVLPWWRMAVLPLAAAAGFAAVLALGNRPAVGPETSPGTRDHAPPVATTGPLETIRVENLLYEQTEDEVISANGASARRERLRYVDTITWQDPRTNASLTWSVPREEVRVVPINYQ